MTRTSSLMERYFLPFTAGHGFSIYEALWPVYEFASCHSNSTCCRKLFFLAAFYARSEVLSCIKAMSIHFVTMSAQKMLLTLNQGCPKSNIHNVRKSFFQTTLLLQNAGSNDWEMHSSRNTKISLSHSLALLLCSYLTRSVWLLEPSNSFPPAFWSCISIRAKCRFFW